jgi:hypothetical protein
MTNSSVFYNFFFVFLVCKCIPEIHYCFQNKNLLELLKKIMCSYLKIFFDNLTFKPLGLYGNLLGLFVTYS